LAGTAISLFFHYGYENLSGKLEASSTELAEVESSRTDALATVENLNEDMELRLKPYREENVRLRERIDELVVRNDDLRDRLDVTFDRNAFLLQRFAEEAAIDEVASVDPLEAPGNVKN
jgi:predicted nuclease with TOPRIM domain